MQSFENLYLIEFDVQTDELLFSVILMQCLYRTTMLLGSWYFCLQLFQELLIQTASHSTLV